MFIYTVINGDQATYIKGVSHENAIARSIRQLFIVCTDCEHQAEDIKIADHYDDGEFHIVKFSYTDAYTGEAGTCETKILREGHEYTPLPSLFPEIDRRANEMKLA